VIVNDDTGNIVPTNPWDGTPDPDPSHEIPRESNPPAINTTAPPSGGGGGGMQPFDLTALKWLASLVLLWIILTAMSEAGPNMATFGRGLAGLILFGALFYLGPGAISNIPNLWKKPGEAGPNPVPGAA